MAKSYYRPSLVLPVEAEEQLRSIAAKFNMDRQDLMRAAVMAVVNGHTSITVSRDCELDEELVTSLSAIEKNAPATRAALDRMVRAMARETSVDARNHPPDAAEIDRAKSRLTGITRSSDPSPDGGARGPAADHPSNKKRPANRR